MSIKKSFAWYGSKQAPAFLSVSLLPVYRHCGFGLQSAQQSSKAFLIGVVIFPVCEVTDMARLLNIPCPVCLAVQDGAIQANRVQHVRHALRFLNQSTLHFVGDPCAGNGMFREDQQQLVIRADRFIDALLDLISDIHVFRSKPASYPLALQVSIEAFGKLFVLARIANKAGVVLDCSTGQRPGILNNLIGCTSSLQENGRNIPLRSHQCINADGRRSQMFDGLKSPDWAQVNIPKASMPYCCTAEVSASEVGTVKISIAEIGTNEMGIVEVGIAEIGTAEAGTAEIGADEVGTDEFSMAEMGPAEVCASEIGASEVSAVEASTPEVGASEVDIAEAGTVEVGTSEVSTVEVRLCLSMLLSPYIPSISSLLDDLKMFVICHLLYLYRFPLSIHRQWRISNYSLNCSPCDLHTTGTVTRGVQNTNLLPHQQHNERGDSHIIQNTLALQKHTAHNARQYRPQSLRSGVDAYTLRAMQHCSPRESGIMAYFSHLVPRFFPSSSRLVPRLLPSLLGTVKRVKEVSQGIQLQDAFREEIRDTHAHTLHRFILESSSTRKERR
jgi:hypothetical protein